ncbi:helix-turn-helix domain-containing protein [Hymenobacter guriensis]|uniref:Helix-turn-helix transcriptional regulator n=1 Tax=Hymenobacter guriensis TaxID=2793065 RepID=A0ABS0L1E1_9BACT|nr:helix-turn-helix transcriptional regulator [Hymenobacter guriensis]MBG8553932.1 helix-turn-helix transcriptional regulator [Hymenobacter guriensis]
MRNASALARRTSLVPRLRVWFGLSQAALGYCLGLSREMVSQVERGMRRLPLSAALPQAALTSALHNTPAEPAPEALDPKLLLRRQRLCRHRAGQLAYEQLQLTERVAWARRRLAALPILTAAVGPAPWLSLFEADARAELLRSGSPAQALLRVRQATLEFEAAEIEKLLTTAPS